MAMQKVPFNGNLNANEIFGAIYNMIISQQVFADNIKGTYGDLVDEAKVDGGLFGDTKLYYFTDALQTAKWTGDSEASNLLALARPKGPECQAVTIDQFRQIRLTVDNYLTKRAWADEGAFGSFNSVMLGWLGDTKRIYDAKTYNAFVGTCEADTTKGAGQAREIDLTTLLTGLSGEEKARMEGMYIAQDIADLMTELKDPNRDFNSLGFLRSYDIGDLEFIWNAANMNKIEKVDLPTIYHDKIVDKMGQKVLPQKYFGTVITTVNVGTYSAATPTVGKPINSSTGAYTPGTNHANGKVNSLIEQDIIVGGDTKHVLPGDEVPTGTVINSTTLNAGLQVYIENPNILYKVVKKGGIPYMSGFEVGTSFYNPRALTETHYLTFGHNTLDYLRGMPLITVKKK